DPAHAPAAITRLGWPFPARRGLPPAAVLAPACRERRPPGRARGTRCLRVKAVGSSWSRRLLVPAFGADVGVLDRGGKVGRALHLALVLRQHVGANYLGRLEIAAAVEAGRDVRAARAVVDGRLWIRTQRARDAARALRGDLLRRRTVLHPVHERVEQVLWLRHVGATAAAVTRPRRPVPALELPHA